MTDKERLEMFAEEVIRFSGLGDIFTVEENPLPVEDNGILIRGPGRFFVICWTDGSWMLMRTRRPPEPPDELEDGEEDLWYEGVMEGLKSLIFYHIGTGKSITFQEHKKLRPE